jgi:hypothetical protein
LKALPDIYLVALFERPDDLRRLFHLKQVCKYENSLILPKISHVLASYLNALVCEVGFKVSDANGLDKVCPCVKE